MQATASTLILGIGNILRADEGFGVRAVEALHRHYEFPDSVRLMDGGTQGIYLAHHVQEADILLVFDAIDYGLPPDTLKLIEGDAVPKYMGAKKMACTRPASRRCWPVSGGSSTWTGTLLCSGTSSRSPLSPGW